MRVRGVPCSSWTRASAQFWDCLVWGECRCGGGRGVGCFGLKTDVEAARFLHDLIAVTFDTESETFRRGAVYQSLRGGHRRTALNSFQVGLASGISGKLAGLKAARQSNDAQSSGFDLVGVKHSVLDDEIDRLGLNFTTRTATSRRYVHSEAYHAGKIAGALFEPAAALGN